MMANTFSLDSLYQWVAVSLAVRAKYGTIALNQHVSAEEFAFEAEAFAIGYPARAFTTSANVTVTAIDDDEVPLPEVFKLR